MTKTTNLTLCDIQYLAFSCTLFFFFYICIKKDVKFLLHIWLTVPWESGGQQQWHAQESFDGLTSPSPILNTKWQAGLWAKSFFLYAFVFWITFAAVVVFINFMNLVGQVRFKLVHFTFNHSLGLTVHLPASICTLRARDWYMAYNKAQMWSPPSLWAFSRHIRQNHKPLLISTPTGAPVQTGFLSCDECPWHLHAAEFVLIFCLLRRR